MSEPSAAPRATVTVYRSRDCHLCDRALEDLEPLRAELGFEVEQIEISGDPELERRYREWIPVVEIAGERLSVYRIDAAALRHKLGPG